MSACLPFCLSFTENLSLYVFIYLLGTHDMAGVKSVGEDAAFDSNLCWAWWPGSPSAVAECLDGRTGLKVNYDDDNTDEQETKPPEFSDCSTFALFQLNLDILRSSGRISAMATIRKSQPI